MASTQYFWPVTSLRREAEARKALSFGSSFYGYKDAMIKANNGSIAEAVMNSVYFEIRKLRNILKRFLPSVVTCPTHYSYTVFMFYCMESVY